MKRLLSLNVSKSTKSNSVGYELDSNTSVGGKIVIGDVIYTMEQECKLWNENRELLLFEC